jgi:hypothetical protein
VKPHIIPKLHEDRLRHRYKVLATKDWKHVTVFTPERVAQLQEQNKALREGRNQPKQRKAA